MHQYIDRRTGLVRNEKLIADSWIQVLYSTIREDAPALFRMATSRRSTALLGWLNYDLPLVGRWTGNRQFLLGQGFRLEECVDRWEEMRTLRALFERRIRYWECRPMPEAESVVVAPSDSRMLHGSFAEGTALFLKGKFFDLAALLGHDRPQWIERFARGDWAIFRLTPEQYHYNHLPVTGRVLDHYDLEGACHACNPTAIVQEVTPFSQNGRAVTILDTEGPGGSQLGLVAMIEVVAMMIGEVEQRYSEVCYDHPRTITPGDWLERGCPKSLFRPGSSTVVLLFEPDRVLFDEDLRANQHRTDVHSRFSEGLGRTLVETEVTVRSRIAVRRMGGVDEG